MFLDMKSIKFIDDPLREKLIKIPLLKEYIEKRENEGEEKGIQISGDDTKFLTYNRLTNLGLFRYYAESWLMNHPKAIKDQTIILRHRTPEGNGLPLEIYLFKMRYLSTCLQL